MTNSSISPDRNSLRCFYNVLCATLVVGLLSTTSHALNSNKALSEYIHDRWDDRRGFPGGPVHAITQTADGYLWLATEKGLVRFDGLNFQLFNHTNSILPAGPVIDLMTDVEGNLWIRPQGSSLLRYQNGKFSDVTNELDTSHSGITAMCRGTDGFALFSVRLAAIYAYKSGKFAEKLPSPNPLVISMEQTADGKFWMGTRDVGLLFMNQGKLSTVAKGLPDTKINSLLAINKELWIGTDDGVVHWDGKEINDAVLPPTLKHLQILALARDSNSNIWIGTARGLLRLNSAGVSSFKNKDFDSSEHVDAIFEDREGNLWVGSKSGVERFRDSSFVTYSASKELSALAAGVAHVDSQNRRWFGSSNGGLYWEKGGQVVQIANDGLDRDVVYSITGTRNEVWIARKRGGLTYLQDKDGVTTTRTYTEANGLAQGGIYSLWQARDGTVWAGSLNGGVSHLQNGKFTTFTTANGLVSNTVTAILEGSDGTMWFATANGLGSLSNSTWKFVDGLPPGRINCLFEDSNHALWIGTDNGLAILQAGTIHIPRDVPASLREPILGVAADTSGFLWISTANHILRVYREKFLSGRVDQTDVREFGLADGLRSVEGVRQDRTTFVDPFGQIWFSTYRGLSVVDPRQVADNSVPAIVHIERIIADGSPVDLDGPVRIAGSHQRIIFSCAGLSLSTPERVRFKYKLDNYDNDWSEPVSTRDVVYTNLGPGSYRFRLLASNSAGLWNSQEASIEFEIEPAFWQRWWFRIAALTVIVLTTLSIYRSRMQRLTNQLSLRFEERLAERTRIAQDLHDTLLQGFLSASMQLHVAEKKLPPDSPARPLVHRVLERMRQVIEEGRTTLKGLRSANSYSVDLAESFSKIHNEVSPEQRVDYRVTVEGSVKQLRPVIRDEIYHIGREALLNAFRHADANIIELELEYGLRQLRVLVRDDGCGVNPELLRSGREGHWGIPGMRERAEEIGAKLKLWSRTGSGTEVELSVPAQIAYESNGSFWSRNWFGKFYAFKNGKKP